MRTSSSPQRFWRPPNGIALSAAILAGSVLAPVAAPAAEPAATVPAAAPSKGGLNLGMGMGEMDKMLDKVDASPDQRTKIKAIVFDAFMAMGSAAPALKATAANFGQSLLAPHVDRARLESARVSAVSEIDAFSKVMVKAIADAAEVLTPEQRSKLAAKPEPREKAKSP